MVAVGSVIAISVSVTDGPNRTPCHLLVSGRGVYRPSPGAAASASVCVRITALFSSAVRRFQSASQAVKSGTLWCGTWAPVLWILLSQVVLWVMTSGLLTYPTSPSKRSVTNDCSRLQWLRPGINRWWCTMMMKTPSDRDILYYPMFLITASTAGRLSSSHIFFPIELVCCVHWEFEFNLDGNSLLAAAACKVWSIHIQTYVFLWNVAVFPSLWLESKCWGFRESGMLRGSRIDILRKHMAETLKEISGKGSSLIQSSI